MIHYLGLQLLYFYKNTLERNIMNNKIYRLQLIGIRFNSDIHLLYGEAVERKINLVKKVTLKKLDNIEGISELCLVDGIITTEELNEISNSLKQQEIKIAGETLKTGLVIQKNSVLLSPIYSLSNEYTLHPDNKFTYKLKEWWDKEEKTLHKLWHTRKIIDIGERIQKETGIAIHYLTDRIGNFLIFERLSSWYLDSRPDLRKSSRWIRPLFDGDTPSTPLLLQCKFMSENETITESIHDIDEQGIEIPVNQSYSEISFSLFNKYNGELLSYEQGGVLSDNLITRTGHKIKAPEDAKGSDGKYRKIEWTDWENISNLKITERPWIKRFNMRKVRNDILNERKKVFIWQEGKRDEVSDYIRELIRERAKAFIYIWDPYFNDIAAKDFLYEIPPWVECKILCGFPNKNQLFINELRTLKSFPWNKIIECKYRVKNNRPIYHDRFLITKDYAWILGSSFNSIGKKAGAILQILNADRIRWEFEDEWNKTVNRPVKEEILT